METTIMGYVRVILGLYWGDAKEMETTIYGLGLYYCMDYLL